MKTRSRWLVWAVWLLAGLGLVSMPWIGWAETVGDAGGVFVDGPELNQGRGQHSITTLADGRVVVFGGYKISSNSTVNLKTAEVWDPQTNAFTSLNMTSYHSRAALTRLQDGNYLVAGSYEFPNNLYTADLYDSNTDTFTNKGPTNVRHDWCTAATLTGGKALVVGGQETEALGGDLYDPVLGTFAAAAIPNNGRTYPLILPTADNQAVILGGSDPDGTCRQVELYDPATDHTITLTDHIFPEKPYLYFPMLFDCIDSHRLPDGRYLLSGSTGTPFLFTFDPSTKQIAEYSTSGSLPSDVELYTPPLVDVARGRAYLLTVIGYIPPYKWRLYTLNLATQRLNQPAGYYPLPNDFSPSLAVTLLKDGRLMVVGGEEHVSEPLTRHASPRTWFITPTMAGANPGALDLLLD